MKDYCYRKVKKKFKVFPSRYAGFALARCRRGIKSNPPGGGRMGAWRKRKEWAKMSDKEKSFVVSAWAYKQAEKWLKMKREGMDVGTRPSGIDDLGKWVSPDLGFPITDKIKRMAKGHYWQYEREKLLRSLGLHDNPRPPKAVARVACRGLKKRRKYKRGGTAVGVARARDLCNRVNVSMRTVNRMSSYFARHRASRAENRRRLVDPVSPARIADELWGGTPGYRWVKKVLG